MASSHHHLIANPVYDAVFKALMEDLEIARGILSVILSLEIVRLRMVSREAPVPSAAGGGGGGENGTGPARVLPGLIRLDFCAVIRTGDGRDLQVLIELQKTRLSGDVLRFRHYLARRYATLEEVEDAGGEIRPEPLPILCVYLLGVEEDARLPLATKVERRYRNAVNGEVLELPEADRPGMVERLTHDAWFVQLPRIQGPGTQVGAQSDRELTPLERVLSVFDQSLRVEGDPHRLDYDARSGDIEGLLRRILRLLHKLQADPEMEEIMSAEDVFELEQKRLHEDLTRELRRELAQERQRGEELERRREEEQKRREEEQKRREEAEREIVRLRQKLEDIRDEDG